VPSWELFPGASRSAIETGLLMERQGSRPGVIRVGGGLGFVEAPFGCDCEHVFEELKAEGGSVLWEPPELLVTGQEGASPAGAAAPLTAAGLPVAWDPILPLRADGTLPTGSRLAPSDSLGKTGHHAGAPQQASRAVSSELGDACLSPSASMGAAEPAVSAASASKQGLGAGTGGSDVVSNPLPPCGSCAEWLRKVNEVQPDFRVLMFRDTSCERVIVRSVQ
jgi:hypothetical protein